MSVYGYNCAKNNNGDTDMYLIFWSLWQWNANDFNNFTTDITVSPSLATCKNIRLYLGRTVDRKLAVLVDDVQIKAKSTHNPTPSPTFSPVSSQASLPTSSPTVENTLKPTISAISCPSIGETMTLLSDTVMIQFANIGVLCTLVKVTTDTKSGNITVIIPLARSYDGLMWELAAGEYAASFASADLFECYSQGCQFTLPTKNSNELFQLRPYQYNLSASDQFARMLERTSFGITQSDLKAISSLSGIGKSNVSIDALSYSMAQWVQMQMIANVTSHREFWRVRANPRVRESLLSHSYLLYRFFSKIFVSSCTLSCQALQSSDSLADPARSEPDSADLLLSEMIIIMVSLIAYDSHRQPLQS